MSFSLLVLLLVLAALTAVGFGPGVLDAIGRLRARRAALPPAPEPAYDPGRERRAERRARDLLRTTVGDSEYQLYESLGFLRVLGRGRDGRPTGCAYLVYPHRPIVAYELATGRLLSEYCVAFPDRAESAYGSRLPDADDVLAKWMSLHGDERSLIADANMHLPGRQIDPEQVRRDLRRLREWDARRARSVAA
jgi:uncharacterized iron-regulated membrane protein